MTHATITPHGRHCAVTMTGYNLAHKEAVKALAGAEYLGGAWVVSVLHLPTLKSIFNSMTVDPLVVAAYHAALRRMCDDLLPHTHRRGNLGQHIAELLSLHANGIAAIRRNGYKAPESTKNDKKAQIPTAPPTTQNRAVSASCTGNADDPALTLWLHGAQNAAKRAERQQAIVRRRHSSNG